MPVICPHCERNVNPNRLNNCPVCGRDVGEAPGSGTWFGAPLPTNRHAQLGIMLAVGIAFGLAVAVCGYVIPSVIWAMPTVEEADAWWLTATSIVLYVLAAAIVVASLAWYVRELMVKRK